MQKRINPYLVIGAGLSLGLLFSCGDKGSSSNVPVSVLLTSSDVGASQFKAMAATDCSSAATTCTPTNISGKVYYAGLMVGANSAGEMGGGGGSGVSFGPIIGEINDASKITSFAAASMLDFDFADPSTLDGSPEIGGPLAWPSDAQSYVSSVSFYFSYIDFSFAVDTADGDSTAESYVVRLVFGDIDGTSFKRGDLLVRLASEAESAFRWCVAGGACSTTRPSSPVQYTSVATYSGSSDGLGNQTIPTLDVDVTNPGDNAFPESEVLANSYKIEVDFDVTDAITWTALPSGFATETALLEAFRLAAQPGVTGANGMSATLTVTKTPRPAE